MRKNTANEYSPYSLAPRVTMRDHCSVPLTAVYEL